MAPLGRESLVSGDSVLERAHHFVEGVGERNQLPGGPGLQSGAEIAPGNGLGRFADVHQRSQQTAAGPEPHSGGGQGHASARAGQDQPQRAQRVLDFIQRCGLVIGGVVAGDGDADHQEGLVPDPIAHARWRPALHRPAEPLVDVTLLELEGRLEPIAAHPQHRTGALGGGQRADQVLERLGLNVGAEAAVDHRGIETHRGQGVVLSPVEQVLAGQREHRHAEQRR